MVSAGLLIFFLKYNLKGFSQVCEWEHFKQGRGKDMFMVDTVSFPSPRYLFGEYVYVLLSAIIYQAKTPLGKGDFFFYAMMSWKTFRLQEAFEIRAHDFKINNGNYRALL